MHFRLLSLILVLLIPSFTAISLHAQTSPDSTEQARDSLRYSERKALSLRGVERRESSTLDTWRRVGNALLIPPRYAANGLLYYAGYGVSVVSDPNMIDRVEEMIYLYERKIGWYPMIEVISGYRARYGLHIFYSGDPVGVKISGKYANNEKWGVDLRSSFSLGLGGTVWKATFTIARENDDDRDFYGIGSRPRSDPRSHFLPDGDEQHALYAQRKDKIQLVLGLRPHPVWETFLTSFYRERTTSLPTRNDQLFSDVYDVSSLPGFDSMTRQWYNEIAARYDTRNRRGHVTSGVRIEGYVGISAGIADDQSLYLRSGTDMAVFLPTIRPNRVLVPRVVLNSIENLKSDREIAFTDYPRHPVFRGTGSLVMLRSDMVSLVPSLEYTWPLSYSFAASIFSDMLMVAPALGKLTLDGFEWAGGVGINIHSDSEEVGRLQVSYGSTGFRLKIIFGAPIHSNDRSDWD